MISGKRKVRAGSDKDEVGSDGKRLRTSSADVKTAEGISTNKAEDTEMEPPTTEATVPASKLKSTVIASSSKLGSTSPLVSRAPSPVVPRNIVKSVSTPTINKKKATSNLISSTSTDANKTASIVALANSATSAPTTPALATVATFSNESRQSSLPVMKKGGEEVEGKVVNDGKLGKKEEEVKEKEKPFSMEGVKEIDFNDPSVIILRGHTTPVRSASATPLLTNES